MAIARGGYRGPALAARELLRYFPSLPMNSATTFDASTGVIDFSVTVAGKAIPCRVTEGWLRQAYGAAALDDGPLEAFAARRATVDAAALRTWLASQGAEPVWLKHDHVWRQPQRSAAARPVEST
jgi:hypothetical protein